MAQRKEKQKTTGDDWDFLFENGDGRKIICHGRQNLRWIKNNWNRRLRRRAANELRKGEWENE